MNPLPAANSSVESQQQRGGGSPAALGALLRWRHGGCPHTSSESERSEILRLTVRISLAALMAWRRSGLWRAIGIITSLEKASMLLVTNRPGAIFGWGARELELEEFV
ncbi:Os02g0136550 [Oryza sativa Japonica Group]|uniref:Os02g0136550 protein n=1 Tax=Oryza sativa subsp. japonica TaxID=39947 RepID=A0A0P0VEG8_ORYSJ|nr:Os02g0136550 [Oryza sativa Japonica Group]